MTALRHSFPVLLLPLLGLAACGSRGGETLAGATSPQMDLVRASNGFGEILPHKVPRLVGGVPQEQVVTIRAVQDIIDNVRFSNPILPPAFFSSEALLPGGASGNQFLYATFTRPVDISSVLSAATTAQSNSGFSGSITVVALEPQTGSAVAVKGRVFIDGLTYAGAVENGEFQLQRWVELVDGRPSANVDVDNDGDGDPDGLGFPGTEAGASFEGSGQLVSPNTVVFVVDEDGDLRTHETFPAGRQIRMQISTAVRSVDGRRLIRSALACTTVGPDTLGPEVQFTPPPNSFPEVTPGKGQVDVDPLTTLEVKFTEPIQPFTLGDLADGSSPGLSSSISLAFGPSAQRVTVPFAVEPRSAFDLGTWTLYPSFNFPGDGPQTLSCGIFNQVDITINSNRFEDFSGNANTQPGSTFFVTGQGPGIVNAPVSPDTIYVARQGVDEGLSVIDLNGFGGGTGNPTFDETFQNLQEGDTQFPWNPNVRFQGGLLIPPLEPGTCTINGGSSGVFTLTRDSSLNDLVARTPLLLQVADMGLGWALDSTFNNGPSPFGCQAGGGNLCSVNGYKVINTVVDGSTLSPASTTQVGTQVRIEGGPNILSWSPHPNPPPLTFPPICLSPYIGSQEPTSIDSTLPPPPAAPPNGPGLSNFLAPGDPFGNPNNGVPPSGLLSEQANSFFNGPSRTDTIPCQTYGYRQQIGHFLYVLDRGRQEVVIFNSNRMVVVDRIEVPDPTSMAVGTNLDLMAVTNQSVDSVTFIDIDPSSSTFHQIVKTTLVGQAPRGIAWEPANEDILVCNEQDDSVSIISAHSLDVRKEITTHLDGPFEVAISPRQVTFGLLRNVYFAWILNRSGRVAFYESGPNAVNGWGYDDVIGVSTATFLNPKTMQPDTTELRSGVWIVHEGPIDPTTEQLVGAPSDGALSNLVVASGVTGVIPLNLNIGLLANPQVREMNIGVRRSFGEDRLSGVPVDIAFDNLLNLGGIVNFQTSFSAGSPVPLNGKSIVRQAGAAVAANSYRYIFAAVPSPNQGIGVIDVISIATNTRFDTNPYEPGIQSIEAPGAKVMMDYFRQ